MKGGVTEILIIDSIPIVFHPSRPTFPKLSALTEALRRGLAFVSVVFSSACSGKKTLQHLGVSAGVMDCEDDFQLVLLHSRKVKKSLFNQPGLKIQIGKTRWALTSCKWSYAYKWPEINGKEGFFHRQKWTYGPLDL